MVFVVMCHLGQVGISWEICRTAGKNNNYFILTFVSSQCRPYRNDHTSPFRKGLNECYFERSYNLFTISTMPMVSRLQYSSSAFLTISLSLLSSVNVTRQYCALAVPPSPISMSRPARPSGRGWAPSTRCRRPRCARSV